MATDPAELLKEQINKELTADELVPLEAATRIVKRMLRSHPDAMTAWLIDQAPRLIAREISDVMRSSRHRTMARAGATRFQAALEDHAGDPVGLYATWFAVNEDNVRRRLADMTGTDHTFVADRYRTEAHSALMYESFHRVLARRVGTNRTGDVLAEEECQRILDQITRKSGRTSRDDN